MIQNMITDKVKSIWIKLQPFRYPLLVLCLGVLLLLIPDKKVSSAVNNLPESEQEVNLDLEERLEFLLSQIDGAGKVNVLLSLERGSETVYQYDSQRSIRGDEEEFETETVLISEDGREEPVVIRTIYPTYKGALIVCQGADSAAVRLNIVQAVSSLTGLGSDKITVVKMKG